MNDLPGDPTLPPGCLPADIEPPRRFDDEEEWDRWWTDWCAKRQADRDKEDEL